VSWLAGHTLSLVAIGALLGIAGSGAHLWITRWRAGQLSRARVGWILATLPLALAPPLAAVVVAIWIGTAAAWSSIGGLVLGRWIFMRAYVGD
jgi:hypothetical protein